METKTVYAYAADGKYLGERILDDTDKSPISGAWQIPGNMTEVKPPKEKDGYEIIFKLGKWALVELPKPEPEPTPPENTEPQEPYIDLERLAIYEAMAEQEVRISAIEAVLKGGE